MFSDQSARDRHQHRIHEPDYGFQCLIDQCPYSGQRPEAIRLHRKSQHQHETTDEDVDAARQAFRNIYMQRVAQGDQTVEPLQTKIQPSRSRTLEESATESVDIGDQLGTALNNPSVAGTSALPLSNERTEEEQLSAQRMNMAQNLFGPPGPLVRSISSVMESLFHGSPQMPPTDLADQHLYAYPSSSDPSPIIPYQPDPTMAARSIHPTQPSGSMNYGWRQPIHTLPNHDMGASAYQSASSHQSIQYQGYPKEHRYSPYPNQPAARVYHHNQPGYN
ncbi:hypothetical protein FRC07_003671 [Ceratobasidium sp. 392]|nr:hypothetical protein FRC07_003671 [Ceratobasidium sp. 392]